MRNGSACIRQLFCCLIMMVLSLLTSCYHERTETEHDAFADLDSVMPADSMSFYSTHHYSVGYNFIVRNDSLYLIAQQPEEHVSQLVIDSFTVTHGSHIAVLDIRTIPQDPTDSVWLQMISEEGRVGWIHETELLPAVVPTDPISQFIMFFSDTHFIIAIIILALIGVAYVMKIVNRRNAPLVHFRDIPSFYPTLLCITVAAAATFYASLQMFAPDTWRHFYYHPTLNPFSLPPILSIFISSVWAMLILGIAAAEDTRHHLNATDSILYICGLIGTCAVLYILFSLSTLYYIGYPLLIAYCVFAIQRHMRIAKKPYVCGHCGKRLQDKGTCPYCGAVNE